MFYKWALVDAESEETFDVINPSDQTKVGTMPNCSKKDTIKAMKQLKILE